MSKKVLAIIAAATANIIFGFSFMFSKIALGRAGVFTLLSWRFLIAFVFLSLLRLFGIIKISFKGKTAQLGPVIVMGLMQPCLYFIFEQYGIKESSSAVSGVVIALVPVFAAWLAFIFLKEKLSLSQIIFSGVSLAGVIIVSIFGADGGNTTFLGFVLLLGAVLCAGIFNILSRKTSSVFSPFERTYIMMGLGFAVFTVLSVCENKGNFFPNMLSAIEDIRFLFSVLGLSILSSVVAFGCYNFSTTYLPTAQSTAFSNIIAVVSLLAGVLIMKEKITLVQSAASLLILIGVWGINSNLPEKIRNKSRQK